MKTFILLSALMASLFLPLEVNAAVLSLSPSSGVLNKGCNVALKVELNTEGAQTDGTDAILQYDASKITPLNIINGPIYPDFPGNFIDTQSKKINISGLASVTEPFSGTGTLATINFVIPQTAQTGATQLTFEFDPNDKAKTIDSNVVERGTVADVLNSVVNGSYTIGSGTSCALAGQGQQSATPSATIRPTVTPSATPLPISELPPAGLSGTTLILTAAGLLLTVLGIVGLALL